ncbi:MAG: hypothetical protein CMG55_02355 [Candidatus Marinimicrobia bacterium]|nr:hypothetical protein [Candidatus Neomarinimicrobiota bacterium]
MTKIRILFYFGLLISNLLAEKKYFQQHVAYEIDVKLNDSAHTLSAFEKIRYNNNSPDTLQYIWFHIWPNAYKNDSTALAKQLLRLGSTRFHYSKDEDRGYIDSLDFSINGSSTNWESHPDWIDVIKVHLLNPLFPGDSIIIETPFFVKLPKIFSRLGHSGKHYEITQWYPKPAVYDKDGWHPMPYLNMGEFYSEFGSFDVRITLPKQYRIMATGDLINSDNELQWLDSLALLGESLLMLDKKSFKKKIKTLKKNKKTSFKKTDDDKLIKSIPKYKTIRFIQDNVHDFAWFADPNWIVNKGELWLQDSLKKVVLWSMYLPKNARTWKRSIEYLHDAGYWYSTFYGDYPYNHITAVDGDMSAGGGMEYPNITVISRSDSEDLLEYVIMHEVGHNWFYGILGNNERDFTWMDEGLNEYSNIRYWEKKYENRNNQIVFQDFVQNTLGIGKNIDIHFFHYLAFAGAGTNKDAQPLNISANATFNSQNYSQNYMRPAVMMRYLQHYIGEEKMDLIMQEFYETWKFRHPSPINFKYFFDKHLDEDVDWFFDNVFDKTTSIDFGIKKRRNKFEIINHGNFNVPFEIAYYNKKGNELVREWYKTDQKVTLYDIPKNCSYATIDPDQFMPDIFRTNNISKKEIETNFIFEKPNYYARDFHLIPWLFSYNSYNGFTPGLSVWNGFLPGYGNNSSIFFIAYDFQNNKPVGSISLIRKDQYFNQFHQSEWSIKISSLEGRSGFNIGFDALKKKPLTKAPLLQINGNIFYHSLIKGAFNPELYASGKYLVGKFNIEKKWIPNVFRDHYLGVLTNVGYEFFKGRIYGGFNYNISKNIKTSGFTSVDAFLNDKNIPIQYNNYLFGSTDPDFNQLVLNRTSTDNHFNILQNTYHGSGIRGIDTDTPRDNTIKPLWVLKIDQSVPYMPGQIFFDFASVLDTKLFSSNYIVIGLKLGPLIIPLYQNWESEKFPNDLNWLSQRIRITTPTINF